MTFSILKYKFPSTFLYQQMVNVSNSDYSRCPDSVNCFTGFSLQKYLMSLPDHLPVWCSFGLSVFSAQLFLHFRWALTLVKPRDGFSLTSLENIFNRNRSQFTAWYLRGHILILNACMKLVLLRKHNPKQCSFG